MLLGIDLGTGSAKALLMTADGSVIGEASSFYPVNAPHPGWAEAEPADWWEGVAFSLRQGLEAIAATCVIATELRLAGGGTLETVWKLLADVLRCPAFYLNGYSLCTRCCNSCRHLLS